MKIFLGRGIFSKLAKYCPWYNTMVQFTCGGTNVRKINKRQNFDPPAAGSRGKRQKGKRQKKNMWRCKRQNSDHSDV